MRVSILPLPTPCFSLITRYAKKKLLARLPDYTRPKMSTDILTFVFLR